MHYASYKFPCCCVAAVLLWCVQSAAQTPAPGIPFALGARQFQLVAARNSIPGMAALTGSYGQRVWDLEEYKGKVYIGLGDWALQSGPQPVVSFNTFTGVFAVEKTVNSDSIENYRRSDGYLYAMHTDEVGSGVGTFDWQGPGSSTWTTAASHSGGMHAFDAIRNSGRVYVATGSSVGAQVRSSGNNGASWDWELGTTDFERFKYLGSDANTVVVTAEGLARSWAKQAGVWAEMNTHGAYLIPYTLNGVMKFCYGGGFGTLSGLESVAYSKLPYATANWPRICIAEPDCFFPNEVMYAAVNVGDGRFEIYATTDFVNYTPILTTADQDARGITGQIRNVWCMAYYRNSLYIGMVNGDFYRLNNVYDQNVFFNVPGVVEAEAYRNMSGIQIESCTEGGEDVGWIDAGDWMEYGITVAASGTYNISFMVAGTTSASMQVFSGSSLLATANIPSTGGWQTWTTSSGTSVPLVAGQQVLRLVARGGGFNLNSFTLTATNTLAVSPGSISFPAGGGTQTATVASNVLWAAASNSVWLTVTPSSGTNNGTLTLTAAANPGGDRAAILEVAGNSLSGTIRVTQAGVPNTPPTITAILNQSLLQDTATGALPFDVGDAETPTENLTLAAASDNPSLIPPSRVVFGGSGVNRTAIVTPAAGQSGMATVTITVADANGGHSSTSFIVTVRGAPALAILDRNHDGISDIWAALYPNSGGPMADPDGDGAPDIDEARAGTDPTNAASHFVATCGVDGTGNLVVRWFGIKGKHYYVETSVDLRNWTQLVADYAGNDAELVAIVRPVGTNGGTGAFWHVVAFDMDSTGNGGLNDWERSHPEAQAVITATAGAHGSISPNAVITAVKGDTLTFSIAADASYEIDQVLVDGQSVVGLGTYTFTNIQAGHSIIASFKAATPIGDVCTIKNRRDGTYMYDAGDQVKYGSTVAGDTYKWIVVDLGNNKREFRNLATGDYINNQGQQAWAQCTPKTTGSLSSQWTIQDMQDRGAGLAGYYRINNVVNTGNYLNTEKTQGYVQQGAYQDWWSGEWDLLKVQ